jgi:hypothetical protein
MSARLVAVDEPSPPLVQLIAEEVQARKALRATLRTRPPPPAPQPIPRDDEPPVAVLAASGIGDPSRIRLSRRD